MTVNTLEGGAKKGAIRVLFIDQALLFFQLLTYLFRVEFLYKFVWKTCASLLLSSFDKNKLCSGGSIDTSLFYSSAQVHPKATTLVAKEKDS